jgi:adenylate cyclase
MDPLAGLFDWLVDGAPGARSSPEVVERMAAELGGAGIPVDRMAVFVTTLHPSVLGRAFWWERGKPLKIGELTLALQQSDTTRTSPFAAVIRTKAELRRRLQGGADPLDSPVTEELARDGYTDLACFPILFTDGQAHVATFATRSAGGFSDEHLAGLRRILRPLARVAEIFALRRTAANLLSTYVGRNSGERILAGRIFKGDIEAIEAVIWFSDLRGFTAMSAKQTPRETIDILNQLFDCQVPAIERRGGEVLKFIGDGLLAIFPFEDRAAAGRQCDAALEAADEAFAALDRRNSGAARAIHYGLALHLGEFAFGNIGGSARLDFTAIGPAVNLAARLEGLTGRLGKRLVTSSEFAQLASRPLVAIGEFELKGVEGLQRVFAPPGEEQPPR